MEQKAANTTSQQKSFSSLIFVFRAPFWIFVCFLVILAQGKNQSYPSEGGDSGSARRCFPCVSSFTAVPALFDPPPLPPSPLPPSSFFLALWNWSVQDKKGNECTLDSALNRLTHFIDDADDTLLMILIKIGSWQADMFQYDNVASVVLPFSVVFVSAPFHYGMKNCRKIHLHKSKVE